MSEPVVSVVIPTTGRPAIWRALGSVDTQVTDLAMEIIVVLDTVDGRTRFEDYQGPHSLRILRTGGGAGGGGSRNIGVGAANGKWIAFLDDDDTWRPGKVHSQIVVAEEMFRKGRWPIVTCRADQLIIRTNRLVKAAPRKLYDDRRRVAEYLFQNRRPGSRRASVFPSTVFVDSRLAKAALWNASLSRHQDWDWLIRASCHPRAKLRQLPQTLATVYVGSQQSISATSDWESSFNWATEVLSVEHPRVQIDFLFAQTLRYAAQARSVKGIATVLREAASLRTLPAPGPIVAGMSGLVNRSHLEALMGWIK